MNAFPERSWEQAQLSCCIFRGTTLNLTDVSTDTEAMKDQSVLRVSSRARRDTTAVGFVNR